MITSVIIVIMTMIIQQQYYNKNKFRTKIKRQRRWRKKNEKEKDELDENEDGEAIYDSEEINVSKENGSYWNHLSKMETGVCLNVNQYANQSGHAISLLDGVMQSQTMQVCW